VARIFEITDIPANRVDEVMQVVKDDKPTAIEKKATGETFTVVATFADVADNKTSITHDQFVEGAG
jgi:hypothetical protein